MKLHQKTKLKLIFLLSFILVTAVAYGFREYALQHILGDFDEPFYLNTALEYTNAVREGNYKHIYWYDGNAEHPIFSKLVYAAVLYYLPPLETMQPKDFYWLKPVTVDAQRFVFNLRRVSAWAGALTAGLVALLNPVGGLLLAMQNSAIHYTSVIYLEALPALFSLLTALLYWVWRKNRKTQSKRFFNRSDLWLLASAVAFGLTAASKYVYCLVGFAILIDALWSVFQKEMSWKELLVKFSLWGLVAVAVFFLSNPILWPHPIERLLYSLRFHMAYSQSEFVIRTNHPWYQPFVWLRMQPDRYHNAFLFNPDTVILVLSFLGFPFLFKKQRVMAIWLFLALGFLLVWNTKWPQYIMTIVAPLSLSAGFGVTAALPAGYRWLRKRFLKHRDTITN